ncbi:MAG: hypothetical protein V1813_04090 [Candidatus Aenigmatarchaeota archaeon]
MGGFGARMRKSLGSSGRDVSGIPLGSFLKAGLSFSFRPKRFLPFFILGLILLFAEIAFINAGMGVDSLLLYAQYGIPEAEMPLFAGMLLVQVLGWIAGIAVTGAIVHQAAHPLEGRKSWPVALGRLPSLAAASFVIIALSLSVSLAPYAGVLLSIIVALTFLFANQCIVISGLRFDRALLSSARLLLKKPAGVLITGLAAVFIGMLIILIFTVPMTIMLYSYFGLEAPDMLSSGALFSGGGLELKLAFMLSLLGESISKVFMLKFLTDIYLHLRKKKWILF